MAAPVFHRSVCVQLSECGHIPSSERGERCPRAQSLPGLRKDSYTEGTHPVYKLSSPGKKMLGMQGENIRPVFLGGDSRGSVLCMLRSFLWLRHIRPFVPKRTVGLCLSGDIDDHCLD